MSELAKTTRRRFAVAALAMVTIAAACSDSSPDIDASVTNDAGNTPDVHVADAVADVPGDSHQSVDASDAAASDAADASDDAADATDDATDAADASDDATASDASNDADMGDAADASSGDASDAAPEASSKGCKGIFCQLGHTCCNNPASLNYGKCELTTCTTCCM